MTYRKVIEILEVYTDVSERSSDIIMKKLDGYKLTGEGFKTFEFNDTDNEHGYKNGQIYPYATYEKEC